MGIILGIIAGLIFLLYSIYFIKIIKGDPQEFELEILRSLADWIIIKGTVSKAYIWTMFFFSLLGEAIYFSLVLILVTNPVIRSLTVLLIALEFYHLTRMSIILNRFFAGKALLSQIFNWPIERASATLFFTHSFLIMVILAFF